MIESGVESAEKNIKTLFPTKTMDLLQKQTFSGANILATKLKT